MGSVQDPRTTDFQAPSSDDAPRERRSVQLDCPPDVAVAFLAKVYSASPELAERLVLERPPRKGAER
jgi:hypothetical protein